MILYLDTSSLVKVFVEEPGYQETRQTVLEADTVATSLITYVEMRAALSRKVRAGEIEAARHRGLWQEFEGYWLRTTVAPFDDETARSAGSLAERHALRALDAIHLASAVALAQRSVEPLVFLSADANLIQAAALEGLPGAR